MNIQSIIKTGTLIVSFLFFTVPAVNAAPVSSSAWKGRSAEATFSADGGGGKLAVFQTGTSAALHFAIWSDDPTSRHCILYTDDFGNLISERPRFVVVRCLHLPR